LKPRTKHEENQMSKLYMPNQTVHHESMKIYALLVMCGKPALGSGRKHSVNKKESRMRTGRLWI